LKIDYNSVIVDASNSNINQRENYTKNFFQIFEQNFIDLLINTYTGTKLNFLVSNNSDYKTINYVEHLRDINIVKLPGQTKGALASAALGAAQIPLKEDRPLVICPGDSIVPKKELEVFVNKMNRNRVAAGVLIFRSNNPRYSYVRIGHSGEVLEIAEKKLVSSFATAGVFYFRSKVEFLRASNWSFINNISRDGIFYIAPCLNYFITINNTVGYHETNPLSYCRFTTLVEAMASKRILEQNA
jgi:hypothetical protein